MDTPQQPQEQPLTASFKGKQPQLPPALGWLRDSVLACVVESHLPHDAHKLLAGTPMLSEGRARQKGWACKRSCTHNKYSVCI